MDRNLRQEDIQWLKSIGFSEGCGFVCSFLKTVVPPGQWKWEDLQIDRQYHNNLDRKVYKVVYSKKQFQNGDHMNSIWLTSTDGSIGTDIIHVNPLSNLYDIDVNISSEEPIL